MRKSGGNFGSKLLGGTGCLTFIVIVGLLIGWCQCVYKAVTCDWDFNNLGKREVIYTVGVCLPPLGGVVDWLNLENVHSVKPIYYEPDEPAEQ